MIVLCGYGGAVGSTRGPVSLIRQHTPHEVLRVHEQADIEGYEDLTEDMTGQILEEAGKIARDLLAPLNQVGDQQGCRLENGVVRTPDGFKEAWAAMVEGGWPSMECDPEYGGQGMPTVLNMAVGSMKS
ncbi:MAG: hypothetical protein AAFQ17_04730, partial [Pseudomonadota bacterium]